MGFGRVGTSGGPERSLVGARPHGGSAPARRAGRVT